jgi:hypothetical protein
MTDILSIVEEQTIHARSEREKVCTQTYDPSTNHG